MLYRLSCLHNIQNNDNGRTGSLSIFCSLEIVKDEAKKRGKNNGLKMKMGALNMKLYDSCVWLSSEKYVASTCYMSHYMLKN